MTWDEENRLMGINDNGRIHQYTYDAAGERVIKSSGDSQNVAVNGQTAATIVHTDDYTGYVSPYFVINKGKFTKHYFEGAGRIVSKLGNGTFAQPLGITAGGVNYTQLTAEQQKSLDNYVKSLGVPPGPPTQQGIYATPEFTGNPYPSETLQPVEENQEPPEGWPRNPVFNAPGDVPGPPVQFGPPVEPTTVKAGEGFTGIGLPENDIFYFHPDHLGSTSYISTKNGSISQHVEYIAFGEVLFEEHSSSFSSPYLFNGKELDRETNLSYFGARYYDAKTSLWLSVDDYKEKYPNISAYVFAGNNPINIIDPDGKFLIDVHKRITNNAFSGSNKGKTYGSVYDHKELKYKMFALVSKDTEQFRYAITGGSDNYEGSVVAPDVRSLPWYVGGGGKPSVDSNHFDNMNYTQINSNFASINQGINNSLSNYKRGKINAAQLGGIVGEFYHAIEDFYSHSNYIELYEKTFGQTSVDKIPTYADALSDAKYKNFADLLKKELHTGEYPGKGTNSHKMMNHDLGGGSQYDYVGEVKDKNVNWNSRAAEATATKAIIQYNNKIESQIK